MGERKSSFKGRNRWCAFRRPACFALLLASLLVLSVWGIKGTAAFLVAKSETVNHHFQAAEVDCEAAESLGQGEERGIVVKNTGTAPAYVRVKLVSYRLNDQGEPIGGLAEIPGFPLGDGWTAGENGFYYYQYPLGSRENKGYLKETSSLVGEGGKIALGVYPDEEGGRQVIEVFAEAIQSSPMDAVRDAWPEEIASWLSAEMRQENPSDGGSGERVQ